MIEIHLRSSQRIELIDITGKVNDALAPLKISEGLCNLFVTHTTAAVIVSENWDPDVCSDILRHLEKLVPREADYKHGEGNSQAHILSVMLGTSINVPVKDGKLRLGRWQGVMFAEFDGPRDRTVIVTGVGR